MGVATLLMEAVQSVKIILKQRQHFVFREISQMIIIKISSPAGTISLSLAIGLTLPPRFGSWVIIVGGVLVR